VVRQWYDNRMKKERITITLDRDVLAAANEAVKAGQADSVSAWVNRALAAHVVKARKLRGMAELIAEYEAKHGVITEAEMAMQEREDRRNAIVIRGRKRR